MEVAHPAVAVAAVPEVEEEDNIFIVNANFPVET